MAESNEIVYKALADSTRRLLLDRLFEADGLTLNELCDQISMSRQAVSKHLNLLEEANLVATRWQGREKLHYLNPIPIQEITDRWIRKFEKGNVRFLVDLKTHLENETDE